MFYSMSCTDDITARGVNKMGRKNDVRPFSDEEYAVIVLRSLKRLARRSTWILENVPPRSIDEDEPNSREIANALEFAIDAVRALRVQSEQE
jgi:hypothetical protein